MNEAWQRVFCRHPQSVNETYFQHMRFAAGFAGQLFLAASAATIHALIPCLFEKTASQKIEEMHGRLKARG